MTKVISDDYRDYVYNKGKLIGEFEDMYKNSKDIPWHQDKQDGWLDIKLTKDLLKSYGPFDYICDFGCGLGYYLNLINTGVGGKGCQLTGYDISQTCCVKGRKIFTDIKFSAFDLSSQDKELVREECEGKRLHLTRGVLLYFSDKNQLNIAIEHMASVIKIDELLLVSQDFLALTGYFVGRDILSGPDAVVSAFQKNFIPLKTIWLEDIETGGSNNWFIGLLKRI